jgi:hypothetical protein
MWPTPNCSNYKVEYGDIWNFNTTTSHANEYEQRKVWMQPALYIAKKEKWVICLN